MTARFVLVHSPLLGPLAWRGVVTSLKARGWDAIVPSMLGVEEARWSFFVERVVEGVESSRGPVVLVGHSGAGPLLPAVGERLKLPVRGFIFVDAAIPAASGSTPLAPPEFLAFLRAMAREGRLPKWPAWWGPEAMRSLVPDERLRARIEEEAPSLPLAYFEGGVPVPPGWPPAPCTYLQFSPSYEEAAAEAESRGWPVARLAGGHLHMLVDPDGVADALIRLVDATV